MDSLEVDDYLYMPELLEEVIQGNYTSSNQDIAPWRRTTQHKEKARLLKIRNNGCAQVAYWVGASGFVELV